MTNASCRVRTADHSVGWSAVWTLLLLLSGTIAMAGEPPRRPNIVLLLADDLGYRDLACYGCRDIKTPNIDRLASEGCRFTSFYSNGPECTPTRAALLTGRYQQRPGGLECAIGTGNVGRYDDAVRLRGKDQLGLPVSHISIARLLKSAGYATGLFGKWHLGYEDSFSPNAHGFDQALYCLGGGMDYFFHVEEPPSLTPVLRKNGKPATSSAYYTDLVADESIRFVKDHADAPFFLYVPFTAPHAPYQGPTERQPTPLAADSPRWNQGKAPPDVYKAMIERLDEAVGRIVTALDQQNLAQDTLVIFLSDNGGTASCRPTGLRGIKGSLFEGGIRVPCMIRWPGRIKPGQVSDTPALSMDLTASIARIAGVNPPPDRPFDGIDLLKSVEGGSSPARLLFWRARRGERTWRAVRDGPTKYVMLQNGAKSEEYLFDLGQDLAEKENLLSARPADAACLRGALAEWEMRVRAER
jgi:arylsulfatase A-like enzyme